MQLDFVVFLDADWRAETQKNRQHFLIAELARQLDGHSKVLGVERPICPWTGPLRTRGKLIRWLRGGRAPYQAAPNLYIYTPFVLLHNLVAARIPGITALNRRLLHLLLSKVMRKLHFRTDRLLTWIHHPYQWEDAGLLGERFLVYDCYDDYLASERNQSRRKDLERRHRAIMDKADCVLAVSPELLRTGKAGGKARLVPNGVEFDHFAQAKESMSSVAFRSPQVLGFTGQITSRIDFRLLTRIAAKHPNWILLMIGPIEDDGSLAQDPHYVDFATASNVKLLGPVPYRDLPQRMRQFDVCLLPYAADDQFNVNCSPLKLYEYLATGKPIVTTDLPAVRTFDGLVRVARDADEFERHLVAALEERDEGLRHRRLVAAVENSWKRRATQVLSILEQSASLGERAGTKAQ